MSCIRIVQCNTSTHLLEPESLEPAHISFAVWKQSWHKKEARLSSFIVRDNTSFDRLLHYSVVYLFLLLCYQLLRDCAIKPELNPSLDVLISVPRYLNDS